VSAPPRTYSVARAAAHDISYIDSPTRYVYTKYGCIYVICCQDGKRRSVPHSEAHDTYSVWPAIFSTVLHEFAALIRLIAEFEWIYKTQL
jgi:hypothetical protein